VDVDTLYASEVRPEIWAEASARCEVPHASLVAYMNDEDVTRLELPVRRTGAGDMAAALEDRGITAFLAADENALARCVGRYLHSNDFLRFAEEVEIHAAEAPRPERLEAEEIRTSGDRAVEPPGAAQEPEEVHLTWR
jgi:hypothetical protein